MIQSNSIFGDKKSIIFAIYIFSFALFNIVLFIGIYFSLLPSAQINQTNKLYKQNLEIFIKQYEQSQNSFQKYSFYDNYYDKIYKDGIFDSKYTDSIRQFSNITQKQYLSMYDIVKKVSDSKNFGSIARFGYNFSDWTRKDTIIRDQMGYNSSYVFAALSAIEYQINQKNKPEDKWITLSAQQIIDCCKQCIKSRKPETVYEYLKKFGVLTEQQYPYEMSRFETTPRECRKQSKTGKRYYITQYTSVKTCDALQKQIAKGPLVVGVEGNQFPEYQYGVLIGCQRKTSHYATLIAIDYDSWKLQNSFGSKWGERGYIRISGGNTCGVCLRGSAPILRKD